MASNIKKIVGLFFYSLVRFINPVTIMFKLILLSLNLLLSNIPTVIVLVMGIVLALSRLSESRIRSILAIIALTGFLFGPSFFFVLQQTILLPGYMNEEMRIAMVDKGLGIIQFVSSFIIAILWLLLLIAIFGWRKKPNKNSQ